jgi:hypothetical protein
MTQVFLECTCPPGYLDATSTHHPDCTHTDIDGQLACAPGSDCCSQDHDHAAMANSCHGQHDDVPCPEPRKCTVWKGAIADARHPLSDGSHPLFAALGLDASDSIPDCPGGHCHKDIKDCAVCRPLIITMLPGTNVAMAGQAG